MSQDREEFEYNLAIQRANELLRVWDSTDDDAMLVRATVVQKLVGAACAWKATKMTDMATAGLSELMDKGRSESVATSHSQTTAALGVEDDDDDDARSPRNLEELKARLNLKKKTDKRW